MSEKIPPELGNLANLGNLGNLGNLANLEILDLADNQLSGCVPGSLPGQLDMDVSDLGDLPSAREPPAHPNHHLDRFSAGRTLEARARALCALRNVPSPCRSKPESCWSAPPIGRGNPGQIGCPDG